MREYEIYFLQRQRGDIWETLASADTSDALDQALTAALADRHPAALRVAAGTYQPETSAWSYQQVFFVDKNSFQLPTLPAQETLQTAPFADALSSGAPERDVNFDFAELKRRLERGEFDDDDDTLSRSDPQAGAYVDSDDQDSQPNGQTDGPSDQHDEVPRSQIEDDLDRDEKAAASEILASWRDRDDAVAFKAEPPQRSLFSRILRFLFSFIVIIILAVIISFSALVLLKHPIVMPYVDKLGLTEIVETLGVVAPAPEVTVKQDALASISLNGPRIDYLGVPSQIHGQWSSGDCGQDYLIFGKGGYITRSAKGGIDRTSVTRSVEDDYYIYLEVSPNRIEHFQKVDAKSLRLIGITSADGFTAKSNSKIVTACTG